MAHDKNSKRPQIQRHQRLAAEQADRETANRDYIAEGGHPPVNYVHTDASRPATYGRPKRPSKVVRAMRRAAERKAA